MSTQSSQCACHRTSDWETQRLQCSSVPKTVGLAAEVEQGNTRPSGWAFLLKGASLKFHTIKFEMWSHRTCPSPDCPWVPLFPVPLHHRPQQRHVARNACCHVQTGEYDAVREEIGCHAGSDPNSCQQDFQLRDDNG